MMKIKKTGGETVSNWKPTEARLAGKNGRSIRTISKQEEEKKE